jgi:hypothetical protein
VNQAQHIWLAIMTELAIERLSEYCHDTCLFELQYQHQIAAGIPVHNLGYQAME